MSDADQATVPMDKLAKTYRRIKGKIQELTTAYETEVAALKEQLDVLSSTMKDQMLSSNVTSVRTTEGTIILSKTTRYSTNDWDAFKSFVVENDALDLFEKRIAQTNMANFLKENPDKLPPGLNSNSEFNISVRKNK